MNMQCKRENTSVLHGKNAFPELQISLLQHETAPLAVISFILAVFLILAATAAPCNAAVVSSIEVKGLHSIDEDEFLSIFGVKAGDTIDGEKVRAGIKRAFLKNIFDDISVHVPDGESPQVIITVREKDYIDKIQISGSYEVSRKTLERLFLFKEDTVMRYDLIGKAKSDLGNALIQHGFPDSEINIKTEPSKAPYRITLHLEVHTGKPLVVRKIVISGAEQDIKGEMKLSEGDIYDQTLLSKDLKRIKDFYKENRHYNPVVGPYTFKDGELTVQVMPGKRLNLAVNGNNALSGKTLLKEGSFFELDEFSDDLVGETIERMLSAYHEKGYASAQIAPVLEERDEEITVTFFVFEGEKIKVKTVRYEGVKLPVKTLEEIMLSKAGGIYNPAHLEKDRETIREFYVALGYLEVGVDAIEVKIDEAASAAELTVTVHEGERTLISSVDITGTTPEIKKDLQSLLGIKPGDPYNEVDISDARFRMLDYYNNKGYPYIDVTVSRTLEDRNATVVFNIEEGRRSNFGKTIIVGNKKTRHEVITRELVHREGDPYSFRVLATERHKLYKLGLFTDVDIEPLDTGNDDKDVLIKVREANAGSLEFGFGYAEYEHFRGFAELSYRNFWGMNRQGVLKVEMSSLDKRYVLQYHEPWFLGRPLPFRAFFMFEDKKEVNVDSRETRYRLERYTATAGIEKKISENIRAELYYEFSLIRTFDVLPDVVLSREDLGTLAISSIRTSLVYDTRDNPFEPRKGILAGITLKIASPFLFSEADFKKLTIYGSTFHRLTRRVILALSLRGGVAYGASKDEELPIVERFFLGGRSSVRGYEQDTLGPKGADGNPTGGNAYLAGNVEFRTSLPKGFGVVAFLDAGNVWVTASDIKNPGIRYTAGLGLRYVTPVGPLRVDYGHKLNKERGESQGEVHFSIGHAF